MTAASYRVVLIVHEDEDFLGQSLRALRGAGYHAVGTTTFAEGRRQIQLDPPRLVVTAARLGAYNGLHLSIVGRCRREDCQAVILGDSADAQLEQEIIQAGGIFVARPVVLLPFVARLIGHPLHAGRRRDERRQFAPAAFSPERRIADRRRIYSEAAERT